MSSEAYGPRYVCSLGVAHVGAMYTWGYEEGSLEDGHFRVETLYTGLSAGTELSFFKGTNPYLHARWDNELGLFVTATPSQAFPVPFLGYMEVGRVVASRTPAVAAGDIVAMAYGHKTGHTAHAAYEFFVCLPQDLDPILGVYAAQMGPICANGLLHAAADLYGAHVAHLGDGVRGRHVLVTGAGVIGLLTGLWARHLGAAEVAIVDRTHERLGVARALGLQALHPDEVDVPCWCKRRWCYGPGDRGADVALQCQGRASALHLALRSLRPQGTVIDLAFYQEGAGAVRLGEEFHHNGLRIQCAQISRVPRGLAHTWNRYRLAAETVRLLQTYGALIKAHLITDVVPFNEAPQLIAELAARRRHVLQAIFAVTPCV